MTRRETADAAPPEEAWPLDPTAEDPDPPAGVREAAKLFLAGVGGGVLALFSLAPLALATHTHGATRSLQVDRERRARCLELGVTPEELSRLEARGEVPAGGGE